MRLYQIEILYTMHTSIDADEKLERIRTLVLKAYPDAKFAEVSIADRMTYFATFRDRLLGTAAKSWANVVTEMGADPDPKKWDDALRARAIAYGYAIVKNHVNREVALRSVYEFLLAQARDDESLKTIFEALKAKDDPKNPVCGTEPGKTTIVYRDFGGKGLAWEKLHEIEDGGVRFGLDFRVHVVGLAYTGPPKKSSRPRGLGSEWEGRQIFRLVAVTEDPAVAP